MPIRKRNELRRSYSFNEVSLVPGDVTLHPDQTDITFNLGNLSFPIPVLAASMDAIVDPRFAVSFSKLGGLAVLNLEGLQTRYEYPEEALAEIIKAASDQVTTVLQQIYSQPVKENLIGERIHSIKQAGGICAVSCTPGNAKQFAALSIEAGADVLFIQSTVTTARHISKSPRGLVLSELCASVKLPVAVGNCVSYSAALELMRTGISAILTGVGPGATCTTREVLGVGVPQITATMDCTAARDDYYRESGRYVSVITDGGIHSGGDMCKAFAAGADAVMLGAALAKANETPGKGYHWGMASSHPVLPRGTRIKVGSNASLEQILFGPTSVSTGTQNLIGALRTSMGVCGASNIAQMHKVEMVIAPEIKTEGKSWQFQEKI